MATMLEPAFGLIDGVAAACALRPGGLALTDEVLRLCPLPPGDAVLDLGCGSSGTMAHLRARCSAQARPVGT
jgi:cyclopropane fatty-acyl-phospholipid synthase-like methyltransferase